MLTIRSGCQLNHAVAFAKCKNYTRLDGTHLTLTRHEYAGQKCSVARCPGESYVLSASPTKQLKSTRLRVVAGHGRLAPVFTPTYFNVQHPAYLTHLVPSPPSPASSQAHTSSALGFPHPRASTACSDRAFASICSAPTCQRRNGAIPSLDRCEAVHRAALAVLPVSCSRTSSPCDCQALEERADCNAMRCHRATYLIQRAVPRLRRRPPWPMCVRLPSTVLTHRRCLAAPARSSVRSCSCSPTLC